MKTAGDHADLAAFAMDGLNELGNTVCHRNASPHAFDCGGCKARERGDPIAKALRKINLAAHRTLGDLGYRVSRSGLSGQKLDDLVIDERRVGVENNQPSHRCFAHVHNPTTVPGSRWRPWADYDRAMTRVLEFDHVSLQRAGRPILRDVSWQVDSRERWVVLGPNGSGKTSILEILAGWDLPSSGRAIVLDEELSTADPEWLRPRIGLASAAMLKRFDPEESVSDAVVSAAYAAAQARGRDIDEIDIRRARRVLGEWGLGELTSRTFGTLSEGEQKRLQLARAIMTDPELLLLDEPTAGLDMAARSDLLRLLGAFAQVTTSPAIVVVTHHIEEIPAGFTHALVLRDGAVVAAGHIFDTVTSDVLSAAYGVAIEVSAVDGGFRAHVAF